jgi:hypothetical protein
MRLSVTTNQEAFDNVVRHLSTMKERSMTPDGASCAYRGDKGLKCAVGALIPRFVTNDVDAAIQVSGVDYLIDQCGLDIGDVSQALLEDLQEIHDQYTNWRPSGFRAWEQFYALARRFDLDASVVDEVRA